MVWVLSRKLGVAICSKYTCLINWIHHLSDLHHKAKHLPSSLTGVSSGLAEGLWCKSYWEYLDFPFFTALFTNYFIFQLNKQAQDVPCSFPRVSCGSAVEHPKYKSESRRFGSSWGNSGLPFFSEYTCFIPWLLHPSLRSQGLTLTR